MPGVAAMARWKHRRAAVVSRREDTNTLRTWPDWSIALSTLRHWPATLPSISSTCQRREPLHPSVAGGVVDLDPAFGEQLLSGASSPRPTPGAGRLSG